MCDKQSESLAHLDPVRHGSHSVPPQSTSVSSAFFAWSVQVGAWHLSGAVPPSAPASLAHTPLTQSPGTAHSFPSAHPAHPVPPQSTSLSPSFCTPSSQLAG
jgi:hypothetical protein